MVQVEHDPLTVRPEQPGRKVFAEFVEGVAEIAEGRLVVSVPPEELRQNLPGGAALHHEIAGESLRLAKGKEEILVFPTKPRRSQ
jgi:hypothetical protein